MKVISKKDLPQQGKLILIYGDTGVGKTTSILQSAMEPLLYIATEPRNPRPSIDAAGRDIDMDIARYRTWFDLMDYLQDSNNTERYATVAIDSLTYLMNVSLSGEIENEAFEAKTAEEKRRKPIVSQTKLSPEG
jgi:predicted ATP-dependent serine protease